MDDLYFSPSQDNRILDVNPVDTNLDSSQSEGLVHDFFIPTFDNNRVYLQWREDENFISKRRQTFYILVGKRMVDIVLSGLIVLFVLSWLFPIIALFILFDSSGPIFFVQARTGLRGRTFPCLKFRTMYNRKQAEFKQTSINDSRVTRVGRVLRKTNLDELPQFLNVLFGSMSIVGPRPHAIQHDAYHWISTSYRNRYCIKPGITGLAQIRGSRGETNKDQKMEHRVRYDLFYVKRQSFSLDMEIFFSTIKTMIKGDKNAW